MSECKLYRKWIEDALGGEIAREQWDELRRHTDQCSDCAAFLRIHEDLMETAECIPEPDPHALAEMRQAVRQQIAAGHGRSRMGRGFFHDLMDLFRIHPVPATAMAAIPLAIAIFLGIQLQQPDLRVDPPRPQPEAFTSSGTDAILAGMSQEASSRTDLTDYWNTPYTLDNVMVRPRSDGQLSMSFDVCRHVDVDTDRNSALAHEVLLHAILEPSSLGSRMDAMALSTETNDVRLREALILTMLNDSSLSVRMEALRSLGRYPFDQRIQDALMQTLLKDSEVQMRMMALKDLTSRQVDMDQLRHRANDPEFDRTLAMLQQMAGVDGP